MKIVVGLGNPGNQYKDTRHNIGFLVVDELARRWNTPSWKRRYDAEVSEHRAIGPVLLVKPQTFMNLSGEAVGGYTRYYKLEREQVLVIIDDVSLPLGTLRLRRSGTAGGHNGLESVLVHLGSESVPRLRVGIGAPDGRPLHDHVLGRFEPSEQAALDEAVSRAADAFEYSNAHGLEPAMNQFNQKQP